MRNKIVAIAIVAGFVLFFGAKLGNAVSNAADSLDRTNIADIAK
jgi:hypothetical protein